MAGSFRSARSRYESNWPTIVKGTDGNLSPVSISPQLSDLPIVERDIDVRTMMSIGSASDYSGIELYLGEATRAKIGRNINTEQATEPVFTDTVVSTLVLIIVL